MPSKKKPTSTLSRKGKHLGDYAFGSASFENIGAIFKNFQTKEFKALNLPDKLEKVSRALLELIQKAEAGFLLIPTLNFIDRINQEKILEHYTISSFEIWLNQFSSLSVEDNYHVRGKIVGKTIPREEYQLLFPISMGKMHAGSHFVTAHSSPDLDTTVASFWGWMDAFGARVSEGLHNWNLPGGPPAIVEVAFLFENIFGPSIFTHVIKNRTSLSVSGIDLMTQKGVVKKLTNDSSFTIDHERNQNAVILVDNEGFYLADWRNFDIEGVRQVILLLSQCLRWFETNLHVKLISLFAKEKLKTADLPSFFASVFEIKIKDCVPAKEFTVKQKHYLQDYLTKVFKIEKGMDSTFEEFSLAMKDLAIFEFQEFIDLVEELKNSKLFDKTGSLIENRPRIFTHLEKIIAKLDKAIFSIKSFVDSLAVALCIKTEVFGYLPQPVNFRAEIDEIKAKMGNFPYLTITTPDNEGRLIPLGVVHSSDVHKTILGTVSLRDFCNREETKIPSYLEVISVIDHHKSSLTTFSPPVAFISDTQSSNALVAELAFQINDKYSKGGMSADEIKKQITEVQKNLKSASQKRVFQRLLQKQMNVEDRSNFYISPKREFIEYLQFLYAILDDTDLLTKVSTRDLECVVSLLNRLKSLFMGKEVEIFSLDKIKKDKDFCSKAASAILQNADMYSLYSKIYFAKESGVEENIKLCANKKPSNLFADTKDQNGCCRVGQSKMFVRNFSLFAKHAAVIRKIWFEGASLFNKERPEIDLHIQMISTIAGSEDVYKGTSGKYTHKDEMWIWIPETEQAIEHLKSFLYAFKSCPAMVKNDLEVEFLGENKKELDQIFQESFLPVPRKHKLKEALPIAILRYNAGSLNSRKAMVSPFLPKLVS